MFRNLVDALKASLLITLVFSLLMGAVLLAAYKVTKESCRAKSEAMKVPWTFGFFEGCIITINEEKIPLELYRYTEDGK